MNEEQAGHNTDRSARRGASEAVTLIGGIQHSQDHRLTVAEQVILANARAVLLELQSRIDAGVTL